jgi:hypothetical protein
MGWILIWRLAAGIGHPPYPIIWPQNAPQNRPPGPPLYMWGRAPPGSAAGDSGAQGRGASQRIDIHRSRLPTAAPPANPQNRRPPCEILPTRNIARRPGHGNRIINPQPTVRRPRWPSSRPSLPQRGELDMDGISENQRRAIRRQYPARREIAIAAGIGSEADWGAEADWGGEAQRQAK